MARTKTQQSQKTEAGQQPSAAAANRAENAPTASKSGPQTGRNGSERRYAPVNGSAITEETLTRGLGWFSIGLGLAEVLAPRGLSRLIGVRRNHQTLVRVMGMREIAAGVGILARERPSGWMWARVGGDALDLALLGMAMASPRNDRGRLTAATAAVAGVTALDVIASQKLSQSPDRSTRDGALRVAHSIAIDRSPEELYRYWRDFKNLANFMRHVETVHVENDRHSHWVVRGPAGSTVEWDAEITEDQPNRRICWRSLEGAEVDNAGIVEFERLPVDHGTMVHVDLAYSPPAGIIGASIARLLGESPEWQVKDDLRRFKQILETGEVITTEGQSAGRPSSTSWRYDTAVEG